MSASAGVVVRAEPGAWPNSSRVLGVELGVKDGCYTEELTQLPNLEGKVEAIGRRDSPSLAAGNSVNDVPMLRLSSGLALCVNPSEELYQDASTLGDLPPRRGLRQRSVLVRQTAFSYTPSPRYFLDECGTQSHRESG